MYKSKYLTYFLGIILCLINYTQYGITTVMFKYLQNMNVQPLSLTAISNIIVMIVYSPRILYLLVKYRFEPIKQLYKEKIALLLLIILTVSILIRCTLFLYGVQLTKSIYFNIINLTSPFFTLVISYILYHIFKKFNLTRFYEVLKVKINTSMVILIIITICSGFITIISMQDKDKSQFKWNLDLYAIFNDNFGFNDVVGLLLILVSMIFISFYNICIKLLTDKEESSQDSQNENINNTSIVPDELPEFQDISLNKNNEIKTANIAEELPEFQNVDKNSDIIINNILNSQNLENKEIIVTGNKEENPIEIDNRGLIESEKKVDLEATNNNKENKQLISNEFIFIQHIVVYSIFYTLLGLIFESWAYLLSGNWVMYLLIIAYGLTAYFLGNVVYFLAISFSSTTIFALFTSVSLISNIIFAGIFIPEEKISNVWTIIGSIVIIISITSFAIIKLKYN